MTNERIEKSLERITDLIARFRIMVKRDMKDLARNALTELVSTHYCFFWSDYDEKKDVLFDTLEGVDRPGIVRLGNSKETDLIKQHMDRIILAFADQDKKRITLAIDFEGAISYFGSLPEETASIVRGVLQSIIATEPGPNNRRSYEAAARARRMHLPDDDPLAISAELWLLQAQFRNGRLFELRQNALPIPVSEHAENEAQELDPIVDRFIELGWTMKQVCEEFLRAIRQNVSDCRPQFMLAMAGAKCFHGQGEEIEERNKLMRDHYRHTLWERLKTSRGKYMIEMFQKFARYGMRENKSEKAFYRNELTEMLSRGHLNRVHQILLILGHDLSLFYAETESCRFDSAAEYLMSILPDAFSKAYLSARYGIAAAMVQQFGTKACFSATSIEKEVEASFKPLIDAINEEYPDIFEAYNSGEPDELFETGRGKEWKDARDKIEDEQRATLEKLIPERKEQINGVTQLAIDLDMHIRFEDALSYYSAPSWPRH